MIIVEFAFYLFVKSFWGYSAFYIFVSLLKKVKNINTNPIPPGQVRTDKNKNNMKNSVKLIAMAAIIAATSFPGCKKGEGDPFLSLKSRKSRAAGEWKVTAFSTTYTDPSGTDTETFDGTTVTYTSGTTTVTYAGEYTYTIEKDGTFKSHSMESSTGYSQTIDETGTWNFTSGVGEMKNKSQIVLWTLSRTVTTVVGTSTTTNTDTYTGLDAPGMVYDIYELKSKEMIWKQKGTSSNGTSSDSWDGSWTLTIQ